MDGEREYSLRLSSDCFGTCWAIPASLRTLFWTCRSCHIIIHSLLKVPFRRSSSSVTSFGPFGLRAHAAPVLPIHSSWALWGDPAHLPTRQPLILCWHSLYPGEGTHLPTALIPVGSTQGTGSIYQVAPSLSLSPPSPPNFPFLISRAFILDARIHFLLCIPTYVYLARILLILCNA